VQTLEADRKSAIIGIIQLRDVVASAIAVTKAPPSAATFTRPGIGDIEDAGIT
jgi:hypothetical protein